MKSVAEINAEEIVKRLGGDFNAGKTNLSDFSGSFQRGEGELEALAKISNKWNLPPSHRKGFFRKVSDFFLKKLFFTVKLFTGGIFSAQEAFNKEVVSHISKTRIGDKRDEVDIDYFAFENKFRGQEKNIAEKQKKYLKYFEGKSDVLDIGCGRGEFLWLLKENKVDCRGLDLESTFVDYCVECGHDVRLEDANSYLNSVGDDSLGGIAAFQVVDQLDNKYLIDMLKLCYKKLEKGAYLILEIPNPKSLSIFVNAYYLDLSHKKPIHPQSLEFLLGSLGFDEVKIEYTSYVKGDDMLKYEGGEDSLYKQNIDMLNNILYGPQDYAVIAKKI